MKAFVLAVVLLSACTVNILAGNCTKVTAETEGMRQIQEQCR